MINVNTFVERRNALKNLMSGTSGIAIFPANNEAPMNYPSNVYRYRQDSSFNAETVCSEQSTSKAVKRLYGAMTLQWTTLSGWATSRQSATMPKRAA